MFSLLLQAKCLASPTFTSDLLYPPICTHTSDGRERKSVFNVLLSYRQGLSIKYPATYYEKIETFAEEDTRYKKHHTWDSDTSVPFKIGTLGPQTVLPTSTSYSITFSESRQSEITCSNILSDISPQVRDMKEKINKWD